MFTVENADFIADKLASELLPYQEYREVAKNAEEAIDRRIDAGPSGGRGRIEFDVDWTLLKSAGCWYVCCADDGDGMTKAQLQRYTTTLAVQGAGNNQAIGGNQGMGLKISGPTRNKQGVLIRSLRNGEGWMVQVGWDEASKEYGLIPVGPNGERVASVAPEAFPAFVREAGHGSVVTFLGNSENDNTFTPPKRTKGWLMKYLHRRFFRMSDRATTMVVRVPAGDEPGWPRTRAEADQRMAGQGGKSFNLTRIRGTASVWDDAADSGGARGVLELQGDPSANVPAARLHWWVLPAEKAGHDVSTRTESPGSLAVLYQNELHDWRTGAQANPFFAKLGIIFGKNRVGLIIEPLGPTVSSDFARAHVLIDGNGVFDGDAWPCWADQFRSALPEAIRNAMDEEQSRLQEEDPDRAKRIRDRLKDVMSLLRPRRFRAAPPGADRASGPATSGPSDAAGDQTVERTTGASSRKRSANTRGIGSLLSQADPDGDPATEVFSVTRLEPRWVTESEADGMPLVHAAEGLHDRAAALVGEDGVSATILLLNKDFRGYRAMLDAVNEWANPEGDAAKAAAVESAVQEWTEQKMLEAVNGLRQLENGSSWTANSYDEALSPASLTAAFMADRFHTLREVRRQVSAVRSAA